MNAFTRVLARELEALAAASLPVCPGWVKTRMGAAARHALWNKEPGRHRVGGQLTGRPERWLLP